MSSILFYISFTLFNEARFISVLLYLMRPVLSNLYVYQGVCYKLIILWSHAS